MTDFDNFSMMELFREEVRSHTATLSEGLLALEQNPSDLGNIEPLMRGAHSIKGASRIVNIEPAVQLSHSMENVFVAIQEGRIGITPSGIDVLLQGTDILAELSELREEEIASWSAKRSADVERLQRRLYAIETGTVDSVTQETLPAPVSESMLNPAPMIEAPFDVVIPREVIPIDAESSMVTVFREEVRSAALLINEQLAESTKNESSSLEQCIEASQSIRGAARLVGIQPVAELGQGLHRFLLEWRDQSHIISSNEMQLLSDAFLLVAELISVEDDALPTWMEANALRFSQVVDRLKWSSPATFVPPPSDSQPSAAKVLPPSAKPESNTKKTSGSKAPELEEAVVRVTAQSLNRLMGLAGESLVQARWLDPFSMALLKLKRQQDRLAESIESLESSVMNDARRDQATSRFLEIRQLVGSCRDTLMSRMEEFQNHAARAEDLNSRLYREVIASRMRPFSDGAHAFPRLVRDMARDLNKQARLVIDGASTAVDRDVLEKLEAPLTHLLRNAIDHGIESPADRLSAGKPESGTIRLDVKHLAGMLDITISDDGSGIDAEKLRKKVVDRRLTTADMASNMSEAELLEFLFLPGFSTATAVTEYSGRGVGLDVVQTMVRQVGGLVRISSELGNGTRFQLQLPITLSVLRAVIVNIAGEPYAFPQNRIDRLIRVDRSQIRSIEHRQFVAVDGQQVGLVVAAQLFDMQGTVPVGDELPVLLLSDSTGQYGLIVDSFQGEQDLVVRPLDNRLGKVATLSAAAILDDGSPVLIADVEDMIRSMDQFIQGNALRRCEEQKKESGPQKRILVVDDSITVREVERQLLRTHGYDVMVAVDGRDGWNILQSEKFDLVVSDVDMPRMNGLELVQSMRNDSALRNLPVIIVSYKEREEDRLRGLEVGANAYLTKSSFHDNTFLQTVVDLIGES